jgi:uncharacterized membrane protein
MPSPGARHLWLLIGLVFFSIATAAYYVPAAPRDHRRNQWFSLIIAHSFILFALICWVAVLSATIITPAINESQPTPAVASTVSSSE